MFKGVHDNMYSLREMIYMIILSWNLKVFIFISLEPKIANAKHFNLILSTFLKLGNVFKMIYEIMWSSCKYSFAFSA